MYVIEGLRQVEGLPKGSFAVLTKIHQAALGDGSGMDVADVILDDTPDVETAIGNANKPKGDTPKPGELLLRAWLNNLVQPFRFARVLQEAAPELLRIGSEVTESMPRNTGVPRTRFNTTISPHRVVDGRAFPLDDLKAIRDCVDGATINDVVIAICGGAMRHYLDRKSELPSETLTLMAPVAVEKGARGSGKSEIVQLTVPAFTDQADPLARLRNVTSETRANRSIRRALGANILTDVNSHAPAATAALGARLYTRLAQASGGNPFFNATITNVPGPQQPLYLQGARLIDLYGIGTLTDGAGLTHMVHSYCGEVTITATACRRIIPDPAIYADCLMDAYDDLMTATAPLRLLGSAPDGDGHPVMVLPGLAAGDWSTGVLRDFLKSKGYRTYSWAQGTNRGLRMGTEEGLLARLAHIQDRNDGRKISLVGWSLGGIFAREIAHMAPDFVRQVITMGSPFGVGPDGEGAGVASQVYNLLNGEQTVSEIEEERRDRLPEAPPVPTTAIYSVSDGVAAWQVCVQRGGDQVENIRVPGSHLGLGFNGLALYAVADRLAQEDGDWTPFDRKGLLAVGAFAGGVLAMAGVLSDRADQIRALDDQGAAAIVNGTVISREVYDGQVGRLGADKLNPMTGQDRAHVLERMIEEEVLIQRGVEIGLVESERAVRAAIVQAMINSVIADSRSMTIDDDELLAFYEENQNYFVSSAQFRLRTLIVKINQNRDRATAKARADEAFRKIADGTPFADIARDYGDPQVVTIPDVLLPAVKVREYVGPRVLAGIINGNPGEVFKPIETPAGFVIPWIVDTQRAAVKPLSEIRDSVEAEYRKRKGDEALRAYLNWLKDRADITRFTDRVMGVPINEQPNDQDNIFSGAISFTEREATRVPFVENDPRSATKRAADYLMDKVGLSVGGEECRLGSAPVALPPQGGYARIEWTFICPEEPIAADRPVRLHQAGFIDLVATHIHFARVGFDDGSQAEFIFSKAVKTHMIAGTLAEGEEAVDASGLFDFIVIGVEHILSGLDHLAFLIAIMFLAGRGRDIAIAITGFTIGHSITLALATLKLVEPDAAAVEAGIGFTIAMVAAEYIGRLTGQNRLLGIGLGGGLVVLSALAALQWLEGPSPLLLVGLGLFALFYLLLVDRLDHGDAQDQERVRWVRVGVTSLFGLIHGFGFAGSLIALNLQSDQIFALLLGFNLGVELGQIGLVIAAFLVVSLLLRLAPILKQRLLPELIAAGLTGVGIYWFLGRAYGV
ncbi:unnamed protein product [Symbiodinium microadriaticum]|nr:unnamed protein product [Symbiodinium microadriaticum]